MTATRHRPRKRFGQHFLHDAQIVERILNAVAPAPGDRLVEIGPGLGAMTLPLLARAGELDAVELDRDLVPELERRCAQRGTLRVHTGDALRFDYCSLARSGEKLRILGNLPYNISTPLLFHLMDQKACLRDMHFMLQKEVVIRMSAAPGTKDYGRLSVMLQYHCRIERLFDIGPGAFQPPPKVDSSLVRLQPYLAPPVAVGDPDRLAAVVNRAFSQRRKTLRNALKGMLSDTQIESAGIDPGLRPENLDLAQFAALADQLDPPTADDP